MKLELFQTPLFKKIDKFVMYGLIPLLIVGILLYVFLAKPVIQLNPDYYFTSTGIRVTGGDDVLPGENIRLWGKYPYAYGTTMDGRKFLLNLDEGKITVYGANENLSGTEMDRFMKRENLTFEQCRTWNDLAKSWNKADLQLALKRQLFNPRKKNTSN